MAAAKAAQPDCQLLRQGCSGPFCPNPNVVLTSVAARVAAWCSAALATVAPTRPACAVAAARGGGDVAEHGPRLGPRQHHPPPGLPHLCGGLRPGQPRAARPHVCPVRGAAGRHGAPAGLPPLAGLVPGMRLGRKGGAGRTAACTRAWDVGWGHAPLFGVGAGGARIAGWQVLSAVLLASCTSGPHPPTHLHMLTTYPRAPAPLVPHLQGRHALYNEQLVYVAAFGVGADLVFGDRPKQITYSRMLWLPSIGGAAAAPLNSARLPVQAPTRRPPRRSCTCRAALRRLPPQLAAAGCSLSAVPRLHSPPPPTPPLSPPLLQSTWTRPTVP